MEFVEAPAFTRWLAKHLGDEEYRRLQAYLAANPDAGDVIPGTGGFRKLRWSDESRAKGRRGGLRVIYYYFAREHLVWLMTLYGKGEVAELTMRERRLLKVAIETELRERSRRTR